MYLNKGTNLYWHAHICIKLKRMCIDTDRHVELHKWVEIQVFIEIQARICVEIWIRIVIQMDIDIYIEK